MVLSPTVTSYRGYIITSVEDRFDISHTGEHVDWTLTLEQAKVMIDYWLVGH
jgi:hypothetical protein